MAFRFGIRRRWLRISMRTLLLIVLVVSVVLAYVSNRARKQQELVRRLVTDGRGQVTYHHEWDAAGKHISNAELPGPAWLRSLIGDHAFLRLRSVHLIQASDDDLRAISQFPSIENLELDEQVRDEGMRHVSRLRNLKRLGCESPHLTDQGLEHLSRSRELETVVLWHARITDSGLRHLANARNLKELHLEWTQVTAEGVDWLRKRLPKVTVTPASFPSAPEERNVVLQLIQSGGRFEADKEGHVSQVTFYGQEVGDEHLAPLASLKRLERLTVMYTRVTNAGIERLLQRHPKLKVDPQFRKPLDEEADAVAALRRVGGNVLFDQQGYVTTFESFDENLSVESLAPAGKLRKLKFIMLTVPRLDAAECRVLSGIQSLEKLWATNADLSDAGIEELQALANLKTLWTGAAADVSDEALARLGKLPALETLQLRRVAVGGPGLASLKNVSELSLLFRAPAEFSDDGLAHVAELTQLRTLSLGFTAITDDGLVHLQDLTNLEQLYLEGSRVTDAGLLELAKLLKLKSLNVQDTEVTAEGVEQFKQLRPDCKVRR